MTTTSVVTVDYAKATGGFSFIQTGTGADYFAQRPSFNRVPATSPYTSALVNNIPPAAEMLALNQAGDQTLTFSETIANPYFAFVSLNRNGYAFLNQDFDIVSVGCVDGNDCGYWGCGGVTKNVVNLGIGNFQYELNASNVGGLEPHGVIRCTGAFDTLTWTSASFENWNGFTVGVEGTEQEILLGDITGAKFNDLNQDGQRDTGEGGLANWIIELLDGQGNVVDVTSTDSTGAYAFADVPVGQYSIREHCWLIGSRRLVMVPSRLFQARLS